MEKWPNRIIRFFKAMFKFTKSGFKTVDIETYKGRLAICNACEFREGTVCGKCGCFLNKKAWIATERCPVDKW